MLAVPVPTAGAVIAVHRPVSDAFEVIGFREFDRFRRIRSRIADERARFFRVFHFETGAAFVRVGERGEVVSGDAVEVRIPRKGSDFQLYRLGNRYFDSAFRESVRGNARVSHGRAFDLHDASGYGHGYRVDVRELGFGTFLVGSRNFRNRFDLHRSGIGFDDADFGPLREFRELSSAIRSGIAEFDRYAARGNAGVGDRFGFLPFREIRDGLEGSVRSRRERSGDEDAGDRERPSGNELLSESAESRDPRKSEEGGAHYSRGEGKRAVRSAEEVLVLYDDAACGNPERGEESERSREESERQESEKEECRYAPC